jgi:disulfide bond formation protein DsbB
MWLQNGFKLHMWLWLAININLDKNEDENCNHTTQQLMAMSTNGWNFILF